jgi:hypothetical protein
VVGDDGADRVALAVVGLLPQQHEVGLLGGQGLGQRVAGGGYVGAGQRPVGQVDRAVGAERDGLVEGADGALRPHRHRDDLVHVDGAALLDLHGGLDGVGVERVEVLLTAPVQAPRRGIDALLDGSVRDLFDQDANFQELPPLSLNSAVDGSD